MSHRSLELKATPNKVTKQNLVIVILPLLTMSGPGIISEVILK